MIKVIIIDDEERARKNISILLKGYEDVEIVAELANASEAVNAVADKKPDLLFLDIKMPKISGFELLDKMMQLGLSGFEVVFLTAYDEFAIKAFKYAAFDYLLKPIDKDELNEVMIRFRNFGLKEIKGRAKNLMSHISDSRKIKLVSNKGDILFFDLDQILFFEADRSYTKVILVNGENHLISRNIGSIEKEIDQHDFCRVHKSYLVNRKHILRFEKADRMLVLDVGDEVRIPVAVRFDIAKL